MQSDINARVNEYNQVPGQENVVAIGDIGFMQTSEYPDGHPMVAKAAIQQARTLGENIYASK